MSKHDSLSDGGGVYDLALVSVELSGPELMALSDLVLREVRKPGGNTMLRVIQERLQEGGLRALLAKREPASGWVIAASFKGRPWDTFTQKRTPEKQGWTDRDGEEQQAGSGGLLDPLAELAAALEADPFFAAARV